MTSHIDKIIAVGERMVGNLNAMGVSASFNDGALTLADKILDVPGLVLDTNISWIASETQVSINQKVTFTGKLFGYYNDTGEDNVDFCGIIKNAPLKLYKGETLIDTTNTDNAGEFAFEFTPDASGSFQFKVVCEDGTNFNGCTSSIITISVGSFDGFSLEMTDGSDILSYVDEQSSAGSQYCTVTCQLLNGQSPVAISGVDVVFGVYKSSDDSLIGSVSTVQTDVNGQADYTYNSHGYGDVYIKAECIFVSKTYGIEDCWRYHTTVTDSDSHFTKYTWGSNWYYLSDYEVPTGFKVIMKPKNNITNCQLGIGSSSGNYLAIQPDNSKIHVYAQTDTTVNVNFPTSANEIIYELVDNQTAKLYVDDTLVGTYTINSSINRYIKAVIYQNNVYDIDYIKIKPL